MNRKNLWMAAAALLVFAGSCQQQTDGPSAGETVELSVTAGIPGAIGSYSASRTAAREAFSHLGGAVNVDPAAFDLRYIMEVWTKEETPRLAYRAVETVDKDFLTTPVTFKMRLQSLSYYFVFWADFVEQGSAADLHYTTGVNLQNIRYVDDITSVGDLAADDLDAYCAVEVVDLAEDGWSKNVTLQRPFGKLRLIATDKLDSGDYLDVHPAVATIDFKNVQFADTYNVLTDKATVSGETRTSGKFDFRVIPEDAMVDDQVYAGSYLLGFDYFFVADQTPAYALDVTVYADAEKTVELSRKSLSGIPVSVNKLTTVIGNFYSSEGTVSVIVDNSFDKNEQIL